VEDLQAEMRELQDALAASQQQRRARRASLVMMADGSDVAPPADLAASMAGMAVSG
jgi:hypothetical protein